MNIFIIFIYNIIINSKVYNEKERIRKCSSK